MDILQKISKIKLVLLVLSVGSLLIILADPPKDKCDAQVAVFADSQSGILSSLRGKVSPLWLRTAKYCKDTKTLGGCTEFLGLLKETLRDMENSSPECVPRLLSQDAVKNLLMDSIGLLTQMAWGEEPPELGPSVYGWMTLSEMSSFCKIQGYLERAIGQEEWEIFVRKTIAKLPKVKELSFQEAYERSFFSVRCSAIF